ncbi:hypothetical protein TNCV_4555861 [Trichonephila clavipes]|nr:hypothetical protein TNCV_4555861 [Trichonephila clavipes]
MNMDRYTNTELADIHFIYNPANGSGRAAVQLLWERYPTSRQSNDQTFVRVHQNHSVKTREKYETTKDKQRECCLSERLLRSPKKSVLRASRELAMPVTTVSEVLHKRLELRPYRLQLLRALKPTYYALHAKFTNDMQSLG